MKTPTIFTLLAACSLLGATFEDIDFKTPVLSDSDPLGVGAITNATNTIVTLQKKTSSIENIISETIQKGQFTNDVVVIGNAKDPGGAKMESTTTNMVFAVNRDLDDMQASNGEMLFSADKIRFATVDLGSIWFGSQTLSDILAASGQGEVNKIVGVTTNGVDVAIDENRKVNIVIPAPGDINKIESITTNGVALPINGKTIALPNYVLMEDLQDGITFDKLNATNLTVNGTNVALEGHTHTNLETALDGKLDATNGVAFSDLKVYPMPSGTVGQTHTIITHESMSIGDVEYKEDEITYNGESYEFGSDTNGIARLKDVYTTTNNLRAKTDMSVYVLTPDARWMVFRNGVDITSISQQPDYTDVYFGSEGYVWVIEGCIIYDDHLAGPPYVGAPEDVLSLSWSAWSDDDGSEVHYLATRGRSVTATPDELSTTNQVLKAVADKRSTGDMAVYGLGPWSEVGGSEWHWSDAYNGWRDAEDDWFNLLTYTNGAWHIVVMGDGEVMDEPVNPAGEPYDALKISFPGINGMHFEFIRQSVYVPTVDRLATTGGVAVAIAATTNELYQTITNEFVKLADLQEGITFDTISVTNLTIDGKKPSLEGHTHVVSDIDGLDSYKNPAISAAALVAIDGINNAQDIATIKSTLTNFLNQFVIQTTP